MFSLSYFLHLFENIVLFLLTPFLSFAVGLFKFNNCERGLLIIDELLDSLL